MSIILSSLLEREPSPPQPIMVERRQLRIIGKLRAHEWATVVGHDAEFEVLSDARPIPDRTGIPLTAGELYVEDDREWTDGRGRKAYERVWIPTRRHPRGTFANGGKAPVAAAVPAKRKSKPMRSVDGLAALPALAARRSEIIAFLPEKEETITPLPRGVEPEEIYPPKFPSQPGALLAEGHGPVRGVAAILQILNRVQVTLEPDRFACHLDARSAGGRLAEGGRELIDKATPLLAAALGATSSPPPVEGPLRCHGATHTGDASAAPVAVTLGPCGMPLCAECVG